MTSPDWPSLPYSQWESTCDTLHMLTQIVGKTRKELTVLVNHWWNVTLYVTPRGLTTGTIPFGRERYEAFEVQFDFIRHRLVIETSTGEERRIELRPRSVAEFYGEYMAMLGSLGIAVKIHTTPDEFDDKTAFEHDHKHACYDKKYVESFHRILVNVDRVLKQFRAPFLGKCSPVQFFWGSFDLAVTRFSGRRCTLPKGADHMTREAYSHEVSSCGFWPGDRRYKQAAFYAYSMPPPAGLEKEKVQPNAAHWDTQLSEFILNYEDALTTGSPDDTILQFCQSAYEAGAKLAKWDRKELERGS
ncbi:MAG TPA: DUF5996 family protein [Candidatus Acidoferrales bacterium]|nr:DUF5996 family protein [Candidatus Acidoferrales bacterium]